MFEHAAEGVALGVGHLGELHVGPRGHGGATVGHALLVVEDFDVAEGDGPPAFLDFGEDGVRVHDLAVGVAAEPGHGAEVEARDVGRAVARGGVTRLQIGAGLKDGGEDLFDGIAAAHAGVPEPPADGLGEVDELPVAGHPFVWVALGRGGDGFDEADDASVSAWVGAVLQQLAPRVAQVGVLVVGEHEDRAVVVGQCVAELTGELEGGVFALAAAEEFVGVLHAAVPVEDVVAELERQALVGAVALEEGQGGGRRLKVDEVQGPAVGVDFGLEAVAVEVHPPEMAVVALAARDLGPLPLLGVEGLANGVLVGVDDVVEVV